MKKAKLLTTLGAVALVGAIGVGSTFAYLSDQTQNVVNTFTVGNVTIDLDETDVDNSTADASRDKANTYANLMPGTTVTKDPIVHVAVDSASAYVYMSVELSDSDDNTVDWTYDATNKIFVCGDLETNAIGSNWAYVETINNTAVFKYVNETNPSTALAVAGNTGNNAQVKDLQALFTEVSYDEKAVSTITPAPMTIKAAAIQSANMDTEAVAYGEVAEFLRGRVTPSITE